MMPIDHMDPLRDWWPDRYSITRVNLRRSYTSYYAPSTATNYGTHLLLNTGVGTRVLVVRGFSALSFSATARTVVATTRNILGSHLGLEYPVWSEVQAGVGQHWYADTTTQFDTQYGLALVANSGFNQQTDGFAWVILPGHALVLQNGSTAGTPTASYVWEELEINDPSIGAIGQFG